MKNPSQGNDKALKRKLAGKKEYTSAKEEKVEHVAPKPRPPTKIVRRGDVSQTVSLPKKNLNSNASFKTFKELGLNTSMLKVLETMEISTPTLIQEMAIPSILKSKQDVVFAAQTGTGKTLAYLLPIAQRLKSEETRMARFTKSQEKNKLATEKEEEEIEDDQEESGEENEVVGKKGKEGEQALRPPSNYRRREGKPRVLILVPNRELSEQVGAVAKSISHVVKLKTETVSGGSQIRKQIKQTLKSYVDILVATPGRLLKLLDGDKISLRDVGVVVLDEGDSLLAKGQGFDDDLKKLFKVFKRRMTKPVPEGEVPVQFVVVTATLTPNLLKSIQSTIPNIKTLVTPSIHKNLDNLQQRFLHVAGGEKHEILRKLVMENKSNHTMVFCNTMDSARSTEYKLKEWGYNATILHGEVPAKDRLENWKQFRQSENSYLVCTDIASRGLDTIFVDHIINFDFPFNTIDYLHRIGRTARAGKSGSVVSLLAKKDQVLANGIVDAVNKRMSLESVSADKQVNAKFFQNALAERKQRMLVKQGKIPPPKAPTRKDIQRPKKPKGSRRLIAVTPVRRKIQPKRIKRKSRKLRDTMAK